MDREIVVIAHDIRSTHNVGSLFRTCEGIGVSKLYLTGYTPYPLEKNDSRLPHIANKVNSQIEKTALGSESTMRWTRHAEIKEVLDGLRREKFKIIALEQTENSILLNEFSPPDKIALILGNEVDGIQKEVIKLADYSVEIPMQGEKESFNVVQAAAMALYSLRYLA